MSQSEIVEKFLCIEFLEISRIQYKVKHKGMISNDTSIHKNQMKFKYKEIIANRMAFNNAE